MDYPIVEIFGPTLQGEGITAGLRTMFVRFGHCDGAGGATGWCKWCDSMFAVDPKNKGQWKQMSVGQIKEKLKSLSSYCKEVTLSGGNPALYDLDPLIDVLRTFDYRINVETQGTIFRPWMTKLDVLTVSPKPPSAGSKPVEGLVRFQRFMSQLEDRLDYEEQEYPPITCVKVPVDVTNQLDEDYKFAKDIFIYANACDSDVMPVSCYLSVVTHVEDNATTLLEKYRSLAAVVNADKTFPDVSVIPQLHVLLWGHSRGV